MTIREYIRMAKTCHFAKGSIPMEYGTGLPIISVIGDDAVIKIPFFREILRPNDKTLIYPIRFVVSISCKDGRIVEASDLSFSKGFSRVEFDRAIGTFRHDAVKNMTKSQYIAEKTALYEYYDKLISSYVSGTEFTEVDEKVFAGKLSVLLEPSLKPFYYAIDKDFVKKYISGGRR